MTVMNGEGGVQIHEECPRLGEYTFAQPGDLSTAYMYFGVRANVSNFDGGPQVTEGVIGFFHNQKEFDDSDEPFFEAPLIQVPVDSPVAAAMLRLEAEITAGDTTRRDALQQAICPRVATCSGAQRGECPVFENRGLGRMILDVMAE
ncbi:MAG TPA: hypothetical protein VLF69_00195 [Candidatus Saccharimonadales bacterium]|nr:hypothetical protein [Candidatus Saccharimonadales bacterium]